MLSFHINIESLPRINLLFIINPIYRSNYEWQEQDKINAFPQFVPTSYVKNLFTSGRAQSKPISDERGSQIHNPLWD